MHHRPVRAIAIVLIALVGAACAAAPPSAPPSASPSLAPATYDEATDAICSAFGAMLRAVGNPDAGTPSILSKALDEAVTAGDVPAAERAAAGMAAELQAAVQQAGVAGRYADSAPAAAAMNTLFLAFGAMITAKLAVARKTPGATDPQAAFEQAGGVEAWTATLVGLQRMPIPSGAVPKACKAFSGTP